MNKGFLVAASFTAASPFVIALTLVSTAHAQSTPAADDNIQLEEVLVTAQRREEKSRDVPISVTTLGAAQLETANVVNLSDTAKLTPGLRFDSQGPAVQPTIRGVGTAVTTSGGGPNVGIYVDGFFNSNAYVADFQLMKAQSIQVLKGPQGTLFGRNTTGGAILVTTADPSTKTSGEVKASYGSYNAKKLQGYGTFGITDNIALDVEGLYSKGDGYFTNVLDGDKKIGQYENWSVRTGLKIDFTDAVSLLVRYTHAQKDDPTPQLVNAYVDNGSAGFFAKVSPIGQGIYGASSSVGRPLVYFYAPSSTYVTKPGDIALNLPISFKPKSDTIQGTVKADLGFADFTSYTQYRKDKTPYYGDLDVTTISIFNILVSALDKSFSQEFLLNSKSGSPLQWTAGLNYYQIKDTWDVGASFGGGAFGPFGGSTTNTKSYAAFVDATYELTDKLFLTAGGRVSRDLVTDASFTANAGTQFSGYTGPNGQNIPCPTCVAGTVIPVDDLKKSSFTPRVVLRYKPSDDSSVYGSFSRGYKAGILNVGGLSQQPVKPETINAFEVGYKYDNRTFALDLASFYYDYKNLQVSSFQSGAAQIRNAASSEIYGLEAQTRYQVSRDFNINAGAAYTHARYKKFTEAPYYSYCDANPATPALLPSGQPNPMYCTPPLLGGLGAGAVVQPTTDASGYHMQRAPEYTGNIGASYDINIASSVLNLSGNLYYTSSFYFDPEQQFKQGGYALLSLRSQWTDPSEHYTVALSGDNLTNKRYRTQVLFNTLGIGNVWSAGATWALQLGAKF